DGAVAKRVDTAGRPVAALDVGYVTHLVALGNAGQEKGNVVDLRGVGTDWRRPHAFRVVGQPVVSRYEPEPDLDTTIASRIVHVRAGRVHAGNHRRPLGSRAISGSEFQPSDS